MSVESFIPKIWSARLLANLNKVHVATAFVNRDYEGEISQKGDSVKINRIGDVTVFDYTKNNDMDAPEELSTEDVTLVVDQAKAFNFQVDDIDKAQAAGDLVDEAMERAAYSLADATDKFIFATIAAAAGKTLDTVALTKENIYEKIVELKVEMDKANVPKANRKLAVPAEAEGLLLLDDRFVKYTETAEKRLEEGLVAKAAGFDIYVTNNLPVTTAASVSTHSIIATIPMATTYAEQITKTEAYRPEKRFADAVKGLHVYGAKSTYDKAIFVQKATF